MNSSTEPRWQGGMRLDQIRYLADTFAYLTPDGWVIPNWIENLERKILEYRESPTAQVQHPPPKPRRVTKADEVLVSHNGRWEHMSREEWMRLTENQSEECQKATRRSAFG